MISPPRLAQLLVQWLVDPRLREAIVGDLEEVFSAEVADGPLCARLRYWARAAGVLVRLGLRRRVRTASSELPRGGDGMVRTLWTDMWHGARLFVAQPGYAWAAVVTLALAIGANTLIFTMASALVLRQLPLADSERLAWIFANGPNETSWRGPVSLPEYAAYRERVLAVTHLSAWQRKTFTMVESGTAERVLGHVVIGDLHTLWGLRAVHGRTLTSGDEHPGAPGVVVLGHRFWSTRFGGSAGALGRELRIDGEARTLVGVLAPDIELGSFAEVDVWLPYQHDPVLASRTDRSWRSVGRLASGATLATADPQVASVAQSIAAEHPETDMGRTARVGPTRDALGSRNTWVGLAMLFTVVGLLLLLACANVTNLLIARLTSRRSELAVRAALGATRGRIVRQIVSESLVLGLAGGLVGLFIAQGGLMAVHAVSYELFFQQLRIDTRVLAFAATLALLAPLAFSVGPAFRMLRADVRSALSAASSRSVGSRTVGRTQAGLVVTQVALAVSLLVVAGLVVQSMQAMTRTDVGYGVAGLISTQIDLAKWNIPDDAEADRVRAALVRRAAAITGVDGATVASELPVLQSPPFVTFAIGAERADDPARRPTAGLTIASPSYFTVMRLPVVAGRGFETGDAASRAPVVVVSEALAKRFFGEVHRALGAQLVLEGESASPRPAATVVGVAADIANAGLDEAPAPQLYALDTHRPMRSFHLIVRSEQPERLAAALRTAVREVRADLPTYQLRTVADAFAEDYSTSRLLIGLFAAFALVAVLLATAGLYGVISYAVSQRTQELAVRMALGASARRVATDVVASSLTLAAIGAGLGLLAAFGLAQAMRSVLFGIGPTDPATYLGVLAVTAVAALLASWLPMRRAMAVDPVTGLRQV